MSNQDSDETEDYDTVQLVREPLNMASIQSFEGRLLPSPPAPKKQGVPIEVPRTDRRPSNYKLEASNPALLTGFRAGGIVKRKPSISQQGQRALSPPFNGSRGDKHKIKNVATANDDYELVGMVPGYANVQKDKQKARALEYVLLSDEEEHKVTPPSSRIKHLSTALSPLSEKATALGMGTFPQASLSAVRCDRIKEFTNPGMTIQFGPERLIINIDKNVTKIAHDNLKIVEVFADGNPRVLVISLYEKLPESSILAEYYDPAPHSGKARKITLLCSCDMEVILSYCRRLSKKKIQVKPLSSDAATRIMSATVVKSPTETSSALQHCRASASSVTTKRSAGLFLFPFKNSAKAKSIAIHVEDISRLDEGEFLNDTLIEFGLKYIYSKLEALNPELADQTYIFNSFFYQRLLAKPGKGMSTSYDAIKSWTNKIDIFSKKFIIVPIHENVHWYLAIITNPGFLLQNADSNGTHSDTSLRGDTNSELESKSTPASPADSNPTSPGLSGSSPLPSSPKKESRLGSLFSTAGKFSSARKTSSLDERPVVRRSSRSTSSAVPVDAEEKPYILVLDSLGGIHPTVTKTLRSYLQQELSARKNIVKTIDPNTIPGKHAKNNKKDEANKYWAVEELTHKREYYREIMISLTEEYRNSQGLP
ncbi:hypothetical protein BGZ72_003129 [Mortierella alpina]|nr:hypothetical protein BGZ72_003129 [Mortierella alpina]